jgi:hypothetical protein
MVSSFLVARLLISPPVNVALVLFGFRIRNEGRMGNEESLCV